jgi:hypothetical protein
MAKLTSEVQVWRMVRHPSHTLHLTDHSFELRLEFGELNLDSRNCASHVFRGCTEIEATPPTIGTATHLLDPTKLISDPSQGGPSEFQQHEPRHDELDAVLLREPHQQHGLIAVTME